jgi:hypothetical protein
VRQRWDKSFVVRSANEPAGRHRDLASELRWSTCSLVPRAEIFEPTRSSSARRCGLYSPSPWPPTHQGDGQGGRVQGRSAQPSTRELDWRQVAVIVVIVMRAATLGRAAARVPLRGSCRAGASPWAKVTWATQSRTLTRSRRPSWTRTRSGADTAARLCCAAAAAQYFS